MIEFDTFNLTTMKVTADDMNKYRICLYLLWDLPVVYILIAFNSQP